MKAFLDVLYDAEEKKSKAAKAEAKKAETGSTSSAKGEVEPCGLKGFDDLYVAQYGHLIRDKPVVQFLRIVDDPRALSQGLCAGITPRDVLVCDHWQ